jgi:hypothetical protein
MIAIQVSDELATATRSYLQAFGHPVPDEVIEKFATRPGPLLLEIRQAVSLQRPVQAWLTRSRGGSAAAWGQAGQ